MRVESGFAGLGKQECYPTAAAANGAFCAPTVPFVKLLDLLLQLAMSFGCLEPT